MAQNKGIGLKEVAHMAELSRLTVSEEEQTLFARQLDDILGYMNVLAKVDTSGVAAVQPGTAQARSAPRRGHPCLHPPGRAGKRARGRRRLFYGSAHCLGC